MTAQTTRADEAFGLVKVALREQTIPGAAVGVIERDGVREVRFGGAAQWQPHAQPLIRETLFDLASLTKVMVTTPAILSLVDDGTVDLDQPVSRYLPDMNQVETTAPARNCTVRSLLSHQSGLPAWAPLYTLGTDPATLKAYLLQHYWPLGEPVYSDLNFMILGIMVERLTGASLSTLPMSAGLTATPNPQNCAATEQCVWRERMVQGEVHDENAFALGGLAGHAGLFGTIDGVLDFAYRLMNSRILSVERSAEMRAAITPERGLGWQIKHCGWSGGDTCPTGTIGHTGFTGTGLWIDWSNGRAWALLTNRVHPSRHRQTPIVDLRKNVGTIMGMPI